MEKECFHFTYLNRAFSISLTGLNKRAEENAKVLKDTEEKISYSEGRYAAAGLFANFYKVYNDIKTGSGDLSRFDKKLAKKVRASESFEEFLGDGMYLTFDGTSIKNTGGNKGHINPYDAGTKETIEANKLKVCLMEDKETGEVLYSKYDFALYLMLNLTEEEKAKIGPHLLKDINFYIKSHPEQVRKFKEHDFEEKMVSIEEFCKEFYTEINEDIKKYQEKEALKEKVTKNDENSFLQNLKDETYTQQEVIKNSNYRVSGNEDLEVRKHEEQML